MCAYIYLCFILLCAVDVCMRICIIFCYTVNECMYEVCNHMLWCTLNPSYWWYRFLSMFDAVQGLACLLYRHKCVHIFSLNRVYFFISISLSWVCLLWQKDINTFYMILNASSFSYHQENASICIEFCINFCIEIFVDNQQKCALYRPYCHQSIQPILCFGCVG